MLVIGGGLAGIRAALAVRNAGAEPLIVSNRPVGTSGSTFYLHRGPWGIHAAQRSGPDWDEPEAHAAEILAVGEGMATPALAQVLAEEAPLALNELRDWGVTFRTERAQACFSNSPRAVLATDSLAIREPLTRIAGQLPWLEAHVDGLLCGTEGVFGALAFDKRGQGYELLAPAVILATGGGGGLFDTRLVPPDQLAQGHGLALSVGVPLENLEFHQMMIGTLTPNKHDFYPLHLLRSGARLLDERGTDLLERLPREVDRQRVLDLRTTHAPFTCSDASGHLDRLIAEAIHPTLEAGGQRHEVAPHAHAWCGGVPITPDGQSPLEGLLCAGEVATGMHGANRLGGNQIAACMVFGRRAGKTAARLAADRTPYDEQSLHASRQELATRIAPNRSVRSELGGLRLELTRILTRSVLVLRRDTVLADALLAIENLQTHVSQLQGPDRRSAGELRSFDHSLLSAQALVASALARSESRGSHYREDHPAKGIATYRITIQTHAGMLTATKATLSH